MPTLGLEANARPFALLVLVNAFVGAMVGMERTILPTLAEEEFALVGRVAILSFIVIFGISKALTNAFAGAWSDRFGRKPVLVAGWLVALPVPFLLLWAPSWGVIGSSRRSGGKRTLHRLAFRRRLTLEQSIRFARTLPVGLRALYVEAWDPVEPMASPGGREDWTREAQNLRANHNFAPESAVRDVAGSLRRSLVDPDAFERVLADLPVWATDFWSV